MPRPALCARLLALLAGVLLSAPAAAQRAPRFEPPTAEQRARFARQRLVDARAFVQQQRLDAAERSLVRGLFVAPEDARLHGLLSRVLAATGREEQAAVHRARANELSPPPPPVPETPLVDSARGLLIALVPPGESDEAPERLASDWPKGVAARTLEQRLRTRLPGAEIAQVDPQTVAEARALLEKSGPRSALSYRVDRSYCMDTIKDGRFAVAWLRVAGEAQGEPSAGPDTRREVVLDPRDPGDCRAEALARGLERSFRHAIVRRAIDERAAGAGEWTNASIRALFPAIGERIRHALERARGQIAAGRIADARATLGEAREIDEEDEVVRAYLAEVEATLEIASELALRYDPERFSEEDRGVLDPRYSAAQRAAAEARLAEARREREDLLAAQAALGEDARAPGEPALAALRLGEILDADAFGPRSARRLAGGDIEARVVYTPAGDQIARYYLAAGGDAALLREEDLDGDGRPDRWIRYQGGVRHSIAEDGHARGTPDLRYHFSPDGAQVVRVEIDGDLDGRNDRIFVYENGRVASESLDTDGDGVRDRFDRFDADGYIETRDEDLDGDGQVDVRSTYRAGRLVERSIREAELAPDGS